jgi:hypothetical protein
VAIETTGALESAITETFDLVFFEGLGGISADVPYPWPVSVGGRPFAIDLDHYQWGLPDMVRQAIDFSSSPGEQSFDTGGVWLRSAGDWSLGAGQRYHDAQDSDQRLYYRSLGINPWTKRQMELHVDTERIVASTNLTLLLLPHASYLYLLDGEAKSLTRTLDPHAASPTVETITGGPAVNFFDITTDGDLVCVATASGIYTHDASAGATMAAYGGDASSTVANIIRFANGFLLVGVGNLLSSVDAAGALTEVQEHRVAAFTWAAIVGTPAGIYAGGQADDVTEIMHIGLDAETGGLAVPIHAGELPRGESLDSLAYYGGLLLIGTSKGFRIGDIQSDGSLNIGPLIDTGAAVRAAYGDGRYVWFGWTDYDSTHTGVGRADLSEFRSRNQPSYATDIMAADIQGACSDVCRFGDHTYFAVSGSGFWRENPDGDRVASGTITLGRYEWGTFEPKTFLGLQLVTEPLVGTVAARVTDDSGEVTELGVVFEQNSTRSRLLGAGLGGLATFFDLELTLTRTDDDLTVSPVVRLVTARALVVPHQIQRWVLPIICKEHIRIGAGDDIEQSQSVAEVRDYFLALRRTGTPVVYQEGSQRHLVVVRDVSFPDGQVDRWGTGTGRDGVQGLLMVTLDSTEA